MSPSPTSSVFRTRLARLRSKLGAASASFLVTHLPDVRYLSGFTGSNAVLAVTARSAVLFTDGRYTTQVAQEVPFASTGIRASIGRRALEGAIALLARKGAASIEYDPHHLSVAELERLKAALPTGVSRRTLRPAADWPLPGLRATKDEAELQALEHAAQVTCQLFESILPHMEPGKPERELAAELEFLARSLGAEAMSFPTIVASGPRSSLPHGTASAAPLPRKGFVTLDFGIILGGYCSDMTRTVYLGKPGAEERNGYEAVLRAQQRAVDAVAPGAQLAAVDKAARSTLRQHHLAKWFTHSTGHGVGLEIHEGPRLAAKMEGSLEPGMVVTIEPGIYLPGRWGIRIEDMVAVTEDGRRVLTTAPKELIRI